MPALHTFSAPCILIDLMSDKILLKLGRFSVFFMCVSVDKTLKRYVCVFYHEGR